MELKGDKIYFTDEEQTQASLPAEMDVRLGLNMASNIMRTAEEWKRQAVEAKLQSLDWTSEAAFSSVEQARRYFDEHMHHPEIYRRWAIGAELGDLVMGVERK
jgi:hypothetical protein